MLLNFLEDPQAFVRDMDNLTVTKCVTRAGRVYEIYAKSKESEDKNIFNCYHDAFTMVGYYLPHSRIFITVDKLNWRRQTILKLLENENVTIMDSSMYERASEYILNLMRPYIVKAIPKLVPESSVEAEIQAQLKAPYVFTYGEWSTVGNPSCTDETIIEAGLEVEKFIRDPDTYIVRDEILCDFLEAEDKQFWIENAIKDYCAKESFREDMARKYVAIRCIHERRMDSENLYAKIYKLRKIPLNSSIKTVRIGVKTKKGGKVLDFRGIPVSVLDLKNDRISFEQDSAVYDISVDKIAYVAYKGKLLYGEFPKNKEN